MKKIGKKKNGMKTMTAIGPMIKPGMKAIGPMMICTTWIEYGYFQKKGKGKGKGKKGKKGKDDDGKGGKPGDGKGKSNYVQPQSTSSPAIQNQQTQQAHYSSAASSSGHGFFSFGRTEPLRVDVGETEPARVDVLTPTYEQQEVQRRTRRGGQNQRDATAHQNRERNEEIPCSGWRS